MPVWMRCFSAQVSGSITLTVASSEFRTNSGGGAFPTELAAAGAAGAPGVAASADLSGSTAAARTAQAKKKAARRPVDKAGNGKGKFQKNGF